jgi:hypothetical protein
LQDHAISAELQRLSKSGGPVAEMPWAGLTPAQRDADNDASAALLERCADITRRVHTKADYIDVGAGARLCGCLWPSCARAFSV